MTQLMALSALLLFPHISSALPLVFDQELPYVNASVNGKSIELMFDLGADAPIALTRSEIAETNVSILSKSLTYGMADGSNFEVPLIRVENLKIGKLEKRDVLGHEFRYLGGAKSARRSGHIGSSLFEGLVLQIDYSTKSVEISERTPDECPQNWKKIDLAYGIPRLEVTMNNKSYWLALDTGSQGNFLPPADVVSSTMNVSTSDGETMSIPFQALEILQAPFDGFLGYDFFLAHSVCLDFKDSRISYEKST